MRYYLADLLNPKDMPDLGLLARVLQRFLISAASDQYRQRGRWGSSGVYESLIDHDGCVNCLNIPWSSDRTGLKTYREHICGIQHTLLGAMLASSELFKKWRAAELISWDVGITLGGRSIYPNYHGKSFSEFMDLHKQKVDYSANSYHRNARVLCDPSLVVSAKAISLHVSVTTPAEMRHRCRSSWDLGQLLRRQPIWSPGKENFAKYCERAKEFFLSGK